MKPEGRTLLGKFRHGFESNVRLNYKQADCKGVRRIQLVQDTVQCRIILNTVTDLGFPKMLRHVVTDKHLKISNVEMRLVTQHPSKGKR